MHGEKMNEKYESQMKKGVMDMLVLRLLESEPKYGYQIINELRERSNERFLLKEGTLYPILYRLEDDGLLVSRWSEANEEDAGYQKAGKEASFLSNSSEKKGFRTGFRKKVPRKYYEITNTGRKALKEIEALWKEITASVALIMN